MPNSSDDPVSSEIASSIAHSLSIPIMAKPTAASKKKSPAKKASASKAKAKKAPAPKAAAKNAKPKGRPQLAGPRPFVCPVKNCDKSYPTSAGLHQHKRSKHPETIDARGSHGSGLLRKHVCPADGCDKSYDTSAGLYQHKSAKHPELVKRR